MLTRLIGIILLFFERKTDKLKANAILAKFKFSGQGSRIGWPFKVDGAQFISLGKQSYVGLNGWLICIEKYGQQRFNPEITIGDNTYIGNYCHIVANKRITIGNKILMADKIYIADNAHDYESLTDSIAANRLLNLGQVDIGDETWIGENVCIFGDIKIGKHCVIAANSVLLNSLPDYSVAAGIPAKVIKRYNPKSKTWERTDGDGNFIAHLELAHSH